MATKIVLGVIFVFLVIAFIFIPWTNDQEAVFAEEKEPELVVVVKEEYIPVNPPDYYILPEDVLEMEGFEKNCSALAQMLWGECRSLSDYEVSLACWCVFNRVDSPYFPNSIIDVISQKGQFHGYKDTNPIDERLFNIAKDTLIRWNMEGETLGWTGRTLPKEYLYFYGKDGHNKYRVRNSDPKGIYDFTYIYPSPYTIGIIVEEE